MAETSSSAQSGGPNAPAEPDAPAAGRAMTIPTRRLVRWAAVTAILILAVLACWQDPVYA